MPKPNKNKERLLRAADAPKLDELQRTLAHFQREHDDVQQPLAAAKVALDAAEEAVFTCERRVLAGKASETDLAAVQADLMEKKRRYAIVRTRAEDAEKMLRLLPAAIEEAQADARADVAANLRHDYGQAVEKLRTALAAANEASQEVARLYDAAYAEFSTFGLHPRYHSGNIDLGSHGLTTSAAGPVPLGWSEFHYDGYNRTRYAIWLEAADKLLARLPHMADDDLASRESAEHSLLLREQQEREKLARLAEIERKNVERFAGLGLR